MKHREREMKLPSGSRQRRVIEIQQNPIQGEGLATGSKARRSVHGRPRALTLAQIAAILAWHDSRVTLSQLAASMGVSTTTVVQVIRSRGTHYKQAPPEEREENLKVHYAHRQALQAVGLL